MKLKTLLAALAVTTTMSMTPALAMGGCSDAHEQVTMSCGEGTQWDAATQTCVPVVSG